MIARSICILNENNAFCLNYVFSFQCYFTFRKVSEKGNENRKIEVGCRQFELIDFLVSERFKIY